MSDARPEEAAQAGTVRRLLTAIAVAALAIAIVWFVTRRLNANFDQVSDRLALASRTKLAVAGVTAFLAMTLIAVGWTDFLRRAGHEAPVRSIVGWYFLGEITKYLPGGLWAFVGRGELAAGEIGRRPSYRTVTHSLLVFFALATVPSAGATLFYVDLPLALRVVVALVLLAIYPTFVWFFGVKGRSLIITTTVYGAAWATIGLTTDVIASAIGADIGFGEAVLVTSAAWLVGFGVFFVPGGIGIRETTFVVLTTDLLDASDALAIAIIARVAFILADVIGAIAGGIAKAGAR